MDYTTNIREMLNCNITPEKIYQTALDELHKIQAEEQQKRQKDRARETLVKAIVDYMPAAFPSINFGDAATLAATVEKVLLQAEKDGPDLVKLYIKLNDFDARYGKDVKRAEASKKEKEKNLNEVFDAFFEKHGIF